MQASCYVHAVQEHMGGPVAVRYVVLVKTKPPRFSAWIRFGMKMTSVGSATSFSPLSEPSRQGSSILWNPR